jgi:hypothetical protein
MIFSSNPCNRKTVDVGSEPAPKADNLIIDLTPFFFASLIKLEEISVTLGIGIVCKNISSTLSKALEVVSGLV